MEIVSELPLFRFVVTCPDRAHMTVLKARWNRTPGGPKLEAELGTRLHEPREPINGIELQAGLLEARTGRRWSREETAELMEQQHALTRIRDEK